jgi:hypothetical protein
MNIRDLNEEASRQTTIYASIGKVLLTYKIDTPLPLYKHAIRTYYTT